MELRPVSEFESFSSILFVHTKEQPPIGLDSLRVKSPYFRGFCTHKSTCEFVRWFIHRCPEFVAGNWKIGWFCWNLSRWLVEPNWESFEVLSVSTENESSMSNDFFLGIRFFWVLVHSFLANPCLAIPKWRRCWRSQPRYRLPALPKVRFLWNSL